MFLNIKIFIKKQNSSEFLFYTYIFFLLNKLKIREDAANNEEISAFGQGRKRSRTLLSWPVQGG